MEKRNLVFAVLMGVGIAVALVVKAFQAPFTHDESFSFLHYAVKSFSHIFWYNENPSANNHLLNTLWIKLVSTLGFTSPGIFRLLSVAGFVLYAVSFTLFLGKKHITWFAPLFLIGISNPYLLDFFAMARGYGFSLGCLALGIALLSNYAQTHSTQTVVYASISLAVSTLSNFNVVYVLPFAYLFVLYLNLKSIHTTKKYKDLLYSGIIFLLVLVYLYFPYQQLSRAQQLYFGGNSGISSDIISDQFWCLVYDSSYTLNPQLFWLWNILFWGSLFYPFVFILARKPVSQSLILTGFLLGGTLLAVAFNHYILGGLLPLKRTALFIVVLFIFHLSETLSQAGFKSLRMALMGFTIIVSLVSFYHLAHVFHTTRYRELTYDRFTPAALSIIEQDNKPLQQVKISANWQLEPTLNFYRITQQLNWLVPVEKQNDSIPSGGNYYYVFGSDTAQCNTASLTLLQSFPEENLYLYRNNQIAHP